MPAKCIRSGRGKCAFDDGCISATHGDIMFNHREDHLPCCTGRIIDVCKNCHSDLPGHILRRLQGLLRIAPLGRIPRVCRIIGYGSNAHNILNIYINCPEYKPCENDVYDLLFYIVYKCCKLISTNCLSDNCLSDTGRRNIDALRMKFGDTNCNDLIKQLCDLLKSINLNKT